MKLIKFFIPLFLFCGFVSFTFAASLPIVFPGSKWELRSPSDVNLDSSKLNQFVSNVGGDGVIIKDGYLVKSWGNKSSKKDWASAAKPVISTLLFFAVEEGKLSSVDSKIRDWGWNLSNKDAGMTFRHLANMVSGYTRGEKPGDAWAYNDYGIKLYGLTMEKVFGTSLNGATMQRLSSLNFEDGSIFSSRSGLGVSTSPRDFARIGWFWLNKGNWNGQQVLPKKYFDNYNKPGVPGNLPRTSSSGSDYLGIGSVGGGSDQTKYGPNIYGFNWWFNNEVASSNNIAWPDAPRDLYMANGHWNKELMVMIPSLNMVIAARGNWGSFNPGSSSADMNKNLKLLKDAFTGTTSPPPLPTPGTKGDLNSDGKVDVTDLGILLSNWGGGESADINGDGVVDVVDLGVMLSDWSG